jgi:hypothetical protein
MAVSQSEGSMLNGRPFKDATSQNADKHCANVENTRKFVPFSRPLILRIPRFFKDARWGLILNEPIYPQSFASHAVRCISKLRMESDTYGGESLPSEFENKRLKNSKSNIQC